MKRGEKVFWVLLALFCFPLFLLDWLIKNL